MKAGAAPAIIIAANAVAEAAIWKERTGEGQDIHVDLRKAWIEQSPWQMDAIDCTMVNGVHKMFNLNAFVLQDPMMPTGDGRWMCLNANYPSQIQKLLNLLNCGPDPDHMKQATLRRQALEMEEAAMNIQVPFHMIRTKEEFEATEQGKVHAELPLISIEKIGESEPIPLPQGERPLSGLRALACVHAVAGPVCVRTLAAQGTPEVLKEVIDGNFISVVYALQAVLPHLMESGSGQVLINTSASGQCPAIAGTAYSATRAGANMLVRCAAMTAAPKGVSVNAFGTYFLNYPGFLDSVGADKNPALIDEVKKVIPLGRLGDVSEAAHFAMTLLDGKNTYQTGNFFGHSGGFDNKGCM